MTKTWLLANAIKDKQSITSDWEFTNIAMIDGVMLKEVKNVIKNNGALVEIVRTDWLDDNKAIDQVFQVTLSPGAVSAWHAHEVTTDRLFVNHGLISIVLYDAREDSPTFGQINEFKLGTARPGLLVVPPKIWHGIKNLADESSMIINLVDRAYSYEEPDHWRIDADSPEIPYRFS
jgi:dTDP-4-dehydrorhamnose 3,5-epimerase